MLARIDDTIARVHVTDPNNPTALLLDAVALRKLCIAASRTAIVLFDEAYNALTDAPESNSMVDLVYRDYTHYSRLSMADVGRYIECLPRLLDALKA